ncbi:MAG: ribose 5-phosphate isomerase B [Phycisphaerales bacterium]|nr:ribose 5-phosphate isomerase B [Phycisphaerales bacterium]MCB9840119.1 ribose 5-phosphate isomerase B [Phycisphaeraceae bacterium]
MRIAIGADHRGHASARSLADRLTAEGHVVAVLGDLDGASCDYPERAFVVGKAVAAKEADLGVLLCGTGIGMSIAANKVPGVRAAVAHDELTAQLSRAHNDANVLCLSADLLGQRLIDQIVDVWIAAEFEGGRHARRVRKIEAIEKGQDPAGVHD